MSSIDDLDLDGLKKLEQAATKGPWRAEIYEFEAWVESFNPKTDTDRKIICVTYNDNDTLNENSDDDRLIAALRNAAPALIEIADQYKLLKEIYPFHVKAVKEIEATTINIKDAKPTIKNGWLECSECKLRWYSDVEVEHYRSIEKCGVCLTCHEKGK